MFIHNYKKLTAEWLMLGFVLVLSGLLIVYFVWNERGLIMTSNVERMRLQTLIIDENLSHQLEGVRSALDSMRATLHGASTCGAECRRTLLQSLKRAMPGVRALLVLDRQGDIVLSDDDLRDRRLDDHDYTRRVERMRDPDTLYLSQPYENTPGVFNIKLSMAVIGADGANNGAVSAILNPEYFDAVMRSALYAPDMNSAITEDSGRRILFVPADPAAMRNPSAAADPFFVRHQRSRRAETVLDGPATSGEQRLVVQRTMLLRGLGLDKTLVVSLGRNQAVMAAGWHSMAWTCGVAWLMFGLTSSGALLLVQRRRQVLEDLAEARANEQAAAAEKVELALNGANLGLWEWHMVDDVRTVDGRAAAMLGYTRDELNSGAIDWRTSVKADDIPAIEAALAAHLADSSRSFEAEYRMRHRAGHWIWVQSRGRVVERSADGKPLRMLGTRMDISARKLAEAEIAHLAFYDGLTNLPNRRLLLDRLHHAIAKTSRGGNHGAVLFVDLDNFKSLNDTMGHDMGDRLLEMVAFRLNEVTRESDTVARLGGDEFVILLEDLGEDQPQAMSNAAIVAGKVLESLSRCYTLDAHELRSTPSIGVVLFGAEHHTINDLLRQADMAMYEAKAAGRATFRFFDPHMQVALDASAMLEADLRFALQRDELRLYYQPVVDQVGNVTGVEALLRWQHPQRGLIPPGDFIPQAEKSGLIVELGDWVLDAACRQLVQWSGDAGHAHLSMAVNVSARQFRQPAFVEHVLAVLDRTGADPRLLKLELTESMLLTDMDDVIAKMTTLKAHGVGFALDDFGTGYSSLSYLKLLPIDQLKIDRSFVHDMLHTRHASSIVRAVITLAYSMDLAVVAEGVETREQWEALEAFGCNAFQGYLFGRAKPVAELALAVLPAGDTDCTPCPDQRAAMLDMSI
ncbi:PAS domain S-box-containing protein/diguanylate cyclase (GGDEF) domain-containing protein [Duganella sp. CF402]|uniref:bifunctional diguanylate cyclase/phosphodiesterase n=1 Tax=unclassified Duganella TaxID=2636909 RepID=UPI0008ABCB8A|nr:MULTISPECIES: EAL domain-containing protein [unclassified Duganella]RZT11017.1 PAS domain S-box-containing protein/diguanylate cyclase (GGDEF)-like protein [Duganella sp. BK701]SEK85459.1 PAS domain S-box-containing protein/diguanylate cyclase (GGDEF) domain-containing protein [Duganella sp. CF402]